MQFKHQYGYLLTTLMIISMITGCQKVIDLKLNNAAAQLVIEGNITNIRGRQQIKISRSVPFTNTNTFPPVSGAVVTVTDNLNNTFNFTEGPAGTYLSTRFTGGAGVTYSMKIISGGQTYTAVSTMPLLVPLDSISAKNSPFNGKNRKDINAYYLDPQGIVNQYLFKMYVNSTQVQRVFVYNDQFTDGRYVVTDLFQNDIDINSRDTVKLEMQCIDKNVYTYWFSLRSQEVEGPGGGTTPSNPPSNISNNALGYFSAHTSQTQALIVP